ncbi:unnamed protein product, partial [Amoebophrya sp. A25]
EEWAQEAAPLRSWSSAASPTNAHDGERPPSTRLPSTLTNLKMSKQETEHQQGVDGSLQPGPSRKTFLTSGAALRNKGNSIVKKTTSRRKRRTTTTAYDEEGAEVDHEGGDL